MSEKQTPKRLPGSPMENMMLLPPPPPSRVSNGDFLYQSSRKRTFTAMDQHGIAGKSDSEYGFTRESNQEYRTGSLSGNNVDGISLELCSAEPAAFRHNSEEFQFHNQNSFPEKVHNNDANIHNLSVQPQSFHYRGCSSLVKVSNEETLWASNCQPKAYNIWPTGENNTFPVFKSPDVSVGKAETDSDSDSLHLTSSSHCGMDDQPFRVCGSSPNSVKSTEVLEQKLINPAISVDFGDKIDPPEAIKLETCGFKQSGNDANSTGNSGISTVGALSLGELCATDNQRSLQYGVQAGSDSVKIVLEDNCKGREHGDASVQLLKKMDGSGAGSSKHALAVTASPRNHDSSVNIDGDNDKKNSLCHGSQQSDEKVRPLAGKAGLAVAEKLWNGSLQLNSSVTISAVAFFKSGEKIPDTKWSESVEVKGKVRLEAFEKYIQDLPRSRNRGLMVISLRLKDGSSEAELARVKGVAKGYKEGKKVGFAQLSPGNDLYICPRSDAIITILAKHGFFKGKAAIEKDHDSLIGCVVCRRKQSSSNSTKGDKKLPRAEPAPKSTVTSTTDSTTCVDRTETPAITCSKALPDVRSSSTIDSLPVSIVPCSSSLSVAPCVQSPMGQSLKPKSSLELEKTLLRPPPSAVMKGHITIYDDDDLPEYDFGIPSGMRTGNGKLSAGRRVDLPLTISSEQLLPKFNQTRSENVIEKMSPAKRVSDRDQIHVLPLREEKHIVQSRAIQALTDATSAPRLKNLFDDDDDMPEWCPPDVELNKQRLPERSLPVERLYPPHVPYPTPSPFYTNPPLPPQPRPHTAIPVNQSPFERHVQKGPRPSINPHVWRSWHP